MLKNIKTFLFGRAQDPFLPENRHNIALVAFLAWIGLGADGLSSSCYGPELGYNALGAGHHHLALYLAILTCITIFIIALSYNQVIELFPNGGGGYKVANELLGQSAGVISGSALLIDYALTIAISVVAGVKAIDSLLPAQYQQHSLLFMTLTILLLMFINLRGMKESIKILLPIFMGFVITHLAIIIYGITIHGNELPSMLHKTITETQSSAHSDGLLYLLAMLLGAYSLGSGTYTGLEAVSNNVNMLVEPRIKTGRYTMMYMAVSLSVIAGGIIILYLLWHATPTPHMTLNASVFQSILGHSHSGHILLVILLLFEAGLLFVGANTGFLGGPSVLSNMGQDDWVPRRFTNLSSRLVKENGIVFFGLFAILIILLTQGNVKFLVIFYSINVFITFTLSLLGLVVYWWSHRTTESSWKRRLALSLVATLLCGIILCDIIIKQFNHGGWEALLTTSILVLLCTFLKRYYKGYEKLKRELDRTLGVSLSEPNNTAPTIQESAPTAVFLVKGLGASLHTILWVEKMFPKHFKNYIFVSYGWVDTGSFGSDKALTRLQKNTERIVNYLQRFAQQHNVATESITRFGTQPIDDITDVSALLNQRFQNAVFFASRYVYKEDLNITRFLHSEFSLMVQRRLQNIGTKMLIVPLKLDI
jgi:amino acid transporter